MCRGAGLFKVVKSLECRRISQVVDAKGWAILAEAIRQYAICILRPAKVYHGRSGRLHTSDGLNRHRLSRRVLNFDQNRAEWPVAIQAQDPHKIGVGQEAAEGGCELLAATKTVSEAGNRRLHRWVETRGNPLVVHLGRNPRPEHYSIRRLGLHLVQITVGACRYHELRILHRDRLQIRGEHSCRTCAHDDQDKPHFERRFVHSNPPQRIIQRYPPDLELNFAPVKPTSIGRAFCRAVAEDALIAGIRRENRLSFLRRYFKPKFPYSRKPLPSRAAVRSGIRRGQPREVEEDPGSS